MDIISSLRDTVDYIEQNICSEISIEKASRLCGLNEYELSNLFHSLTGMTIREYIRKRRLTLAALDIRNSSEKLIDIAFKYGYESPDSFRRAFAAQHNINPSEARDKEASLNIYPPLSFEINVKGAEKMNFRIVDIDDIEVFGITVPCFSSEEIRYQLAKELWSDEAQHLPSKICDGYDGIWYAVWTSSSYTIARDRSNCTKPNLSKTVIPAGKYAVFTTDKGGYAGDELPKLHNQIFDSRFPLSEYTISRDFELEIYHLATDKTTRRRERYYEIWVPITEKSDANGKSDVVIRKADVSDAASLSEICSSELGYACTSAILKSKLALVDDRREQVYVAEINGKAVGFVHIELYDVLYCDKGSNILGLAVSSDYRRQGIGSALLNEAESWAKKQGASFVRLNSGGKRTEAHKFYRSVGYDNEKEQIRFMKMTD